MLKSTATMAEIKKHIGGKDWVVLSLSQEEAEKVAKEKRVGSWMIYFFINISADEIESWTEYLDELGISLEDNRD